MFRQSIKIISNSQLKGSLSFQSIRHNQCGMKKICAEEVIRMDDVINKQAKKKCGKLCPEVFENSCKVEKPICKKGKVPPVCVKKTSVPHFVKRENPSLSFSEMLYLLRKKCTYVNKF